MHNNFVLITVHEIHFGAICPAHTLNEIKSRLIFIATLELQMHPNFFCMKHVFLKRVKESV